MIIIDIKFEGLRNIYICYVIYIMLELLHNLDGAKEEEKFLFGFPEQYSESITLTVAFIHYRYSHHVNLIFLF